MLLFTVFFFHFLLLTLGLALASWLSQVEGNISMFTQDGIPDKIHRPKYITY